jgi:hypothetical protein
MNEIFNFRRQLNIAKVLVVIASFIIIIIIAFVFFTPNNNEKPLSTNTIIETHENKISDFKSKNNEIILSLNNSYGLSQFDSIQDYILELRSEDNLNIFIEKKNLSTDKILYNLVSKDKEIYIEEFNSISNISDIREITIADGIIGYTYGFHYLDNRMKKPFYLQIIWIQKNSNYYILSAEFPLDKLDSYSKIINEITTNLKFN